MPTVADRAHRIDRLESAWRVIRANGRHSQSKFTRAEIRQFDEDAGQHLRKISRNLKKGIFEFLPASGHPISRGKGKTHRPIVRSPIPSRIVQRSVLDCLLLIPSLNQVISNPNSFGGISKTAGQTYGAVPAAINEVVKEIRLGAKYYIRSDIDSFFANLPRDVVVQKLCSFVSDSESIDLAKRAIDTELDNLAELRESKLAHLFPTHELGVAQGNCLSPFLGNLLLGDFDSVMSTGACRCIRYIDDFIILGPNKSETRKRFREIRTYLSKFNLTAYDPRKNPEKADKGDIDTGLEFLGVQLQSGSIKPAKKARRKFLKSIDEAIADSIENMTQNPNDGIRHELSLSQTLARLSGMIKGWGDQYFYCNERNVFKTLDDQIDIRLGKFIGRYDDLRKGTGDQKHRRKLLGVSLLAESKNEPMAWNGPEAQ